ncbi:hypothetical protein ACFPRL_02835 [Pseudoclavibacter helvolus]
MPHHAPPSTTTSSHFGTGHLAGPVFCARKCPRWLHFPPPR